MANTASMPAEGQILVNIEDMSLLKDIKKAISMVKGVVHSTTSATVASTTTRTARSFSRKWASDGLQDFHHPPVRERLEALYQAWLSDGRIPHWKQKGNELELLMLNTGTHSDLFGKNRR